MKVYHWASLLVFSGFITSVQAGGLGLGEVNVSVGQAVQASGGLQGKLTSQGYTNVTGTHDGTDTSYKLSYSHPLGARWGGEVGYVDLGNADTNLTLTAPAGTTGVQAASTVSSSLPKRGQGVTIGGYYKLPVTSRFNVKYGAGAYIWEDEHKVTVNNVEYTHDNDGVDPYASVSMGYQMNNKATLSLDVERYFMPEADVKRIGLGFSYDF